jgi:pyridoxal phosphate enzyme (YggS family)
MIGHLQTNKVKKALDIFELVQSVDSWRLAEELSSRASQRKKVTDILVEVNTSGEHTKFGIEPDEAPRFVQEISSLAGIRVRGLMTIAIFAADPEVVRPCFTRLRRLKDEIEEKGITQLELLSMGMTSDFEVAIEEGSDMVRIGTGIFGPRHR